MSTTVPRTTGIARLSPGRGTSTSADELPACATTGACLRNVVAPSLLRRGSDSATRPICSLDRLAYFWGIGVRARARGSLSCRQTRDMRASGLIGFIGAIGSSGSTGSPGATGPAGVIRPRGSTGSRGVVGPLGSAESASARGPTTTRPGSSASTGRIFAVPEAALSYYVHRVDVPRGPTDEIQVGLLDLQRLQHTPCKGAIIFLGGFRDSPPSDPQPNRKRIVRPRCEDDPQEHDGV